MNLYEVDVEWLVRTRITVEAESTDEAEAHAQRAVSGLFLDLQDEDQRLGVSDPDVTAWIVKDDDEDTVTSGTLPHGYHLDSGAGLHD